VINVQWPFFDFVLKQLNVYSVKYVLSNCIS